MVMDIKVFMLSLAYSGTQYVSFGFVFELIVPSFSLHLVQVFFKCNHVICQDVPDSLFFIFSLSFMNSTNIS